jgi:hypothetical protein
VTLRVRLSVFWHGDYVIEVHVLGKTPLLQNRLHPDADLTEERRIAFIKTCHFA